MTGKVKWACPKCGAEAHKHGKGGADRCEDSMAGKHGCEGFICECWEDYPCAENAGHGETHDNPCRNAVCYHCRWHGRFPALSKKAKPWEKQALKAGWTPPKGWGT